MAIDDEQHKNLQDLLQASRRRLAVLELQRATFGLHAPPHVITEIDDLRAAIAHIETELNRDTPAMDRARLEQLRQQGRKAYFRKDWAQAADLLAQVAAHDPDDDTRAKLAEARRQLRLQEDYRAIGELRSEGLWQAVLDALEDLERRQPGYPDAEGLRDWAEGRRRREQRYADAMSARTRKDWSKTIAALEALLAEFPDDEAQALLAQACSEQQAAEEQEQRRREMEERRRQETAERVQRERLSSSLGYIQAGNFTKALDILEAMLAQQPTDREGAMLIAGLIENPQVPLEQRLRAGRLAGEAGDPRPGVCTLDPAWCGPFPAGEYPIANGKAKVRLGEFRIARYTVTVWQFRQFWENGGYKERRWWTPKGWEWKGDRTQPYRWDEANWTAPNQPVIGVSWYEAVAFCNWLTERGKLAGWLKAGQMVRLPSEAEWEVAAMWDERKKEMRPWQPLEGEIWQNVKEAGIGCTSPVGIFPQGASPCGAVDMAGNAWEWCSSAYGDYPQAALLREDLSASHIVSLRGGAYYLQNNGSGGGVRIRLVPVSIFYYGGFRVVVASGLAC